MAEGVEKPATRGAMMLSFGEAMRSVGAGAELLVERLQSGVSYNPLSSRTAQDPYPVYAARPLLGRGGSGTGRSRAGVGAGRARGGEVASLDGRAHLGRGQGRLGVELRELDARAGPALDPEGQGAGRRRLARPRAPPCAGAVAGRADNGAGRVAAVRPAASGKSRCGIRRPALPSLARDGRCIGNVPAIRAVAADIWGREFDSISLRIEDRSECSCYNSL